MSLCGSGWVKNVSVRICTKKNLLRSHDVQKHTNDSVIDNFLDLVYGYIGMWSAWNEPKNNFCVGTFLLSAGGLRHLLPDAPVCKEVFCALSQIPARLLTPLHLLEGLKPPPLQTQHWLGTRLLAVETAFESKGQFRVERSMHQAHVNHAFTFEAWWETDDYCHDMDVWIWM